MKAGIRSAPHLNTAVDGSSVIFPVAHQDHVGLLSFSTLPGMNSEVNSNSKKFHLIGMSSFLSGWFA